MKRSHLSQSLGHLIQWFIRTIFRNRPYHGYPFCGKPFRSFPKFNHVAQAPNFSFLGGGGGGACCLTILMKEFPESEIQAKFFADAGEKSSEDLAKKFPDFRPLISRKSGCKKFHKKILHFSTRDKQNSFTARFWEGGCPNNTSTATIGIHLKARERLKCTCRK